MIKLIIKKLSKLASTLGIITFILFLLMSLLFTYQEYRYPYSISPLLKHKFLYVLTGSMEPTIHPNDVIIIKTINTNKIQVNDIITFIDNDTIVTHRVYNVNDNNNSVSFITKGDANETIDENFVLPDQVLGKCIIIIPKLGHVLKFISSPICFISIIVLPILYVIISEVKSIIKQ